MSEHVTIQGMQGMGDCLHQRAFLRVMIERGMFLTLFTSWPCLYHDLVGPQLKLYASNTGLRTQRKNIRRETNKFTQGPASSGRSLHITYTIDLVKQYGSVLGAMMARAGYPDAPRDFRLPVPDTWTAKADALLDQLKPTKPLLIYRPLVDRREWRADTRNPDPTGYVQILRSIRDQFYVISLADLEPSIEWLVSEDVKPDAQFHEGQLDVECIAALVKKAHLTFAAPGFMTIMAQAVGTRNVTVYGGYEDRRTLSGGAAFTPSLALEPRKPCMCFRHGCKCSKDIDVEQAVQALRSFLVPAS